MAESLFYAVIVGMALALLYDFFRFFRLVFNDRFFLDFIFWIISAMVTFCYLLIFNNGEIRAIYFVLIFVGFASITLCLGYVSKPIQQKLAKKIKIRLKSFKKVLQNRCIIYYNKIKCAKGLKAKPEGDKNGKGNRKKE